MKAFINRVSFAMQGWAAFFSKETNGQIQLCVAIAIIIAGFVFGLSAMEWVIILGCIGLILALEMMNSAIEKLCDLVHPEKHPTIKFVKDVAAGAVLWASVMAVAIGAIIFLPKVILLIQVSGH
jgi:diacylglycerol kinase